MISDLLFMKYRSLSLPVAKEISEIMIIALPLFICIGVLTAHFSREENSKVLLNLIGALFLYASFEGALSSSINLGGKVGNKFLSGNSFITKIIKRTRNYKDTSKSFKPVEPDLMGGEFFLYSYLRTILEFISSNFMTWTLLVLAIINTVAFAIIKTIYPLLLGLSVIPLFYNIQRSMVLYLAFCFLLPVCVGCILGTYEYLVVDDIKQFNIFLQFCFSLAFIFSLGFSMKYVYNILASDGIAQTVSSAGQSMVTMGANWATGLAVAGLVTKPRQLVSAMAGRGGGLLKDTIGSRGKLLGSTLEASGVKYSQVANKGVMSALKGSNFKAKLLSGVGASDRSEALGVLEFAKHMSKGSQHKGDQVFSDSAYQEWKKANSAFNKDVPAGVISGVKTTDYGSNLNKHPYFSKSISQRNSDPYGLSSNDSNIVANRDAVGSQMSENSYFGGKKQFENPYDMNVQKRSTNPNRSADSSNLTNNSYLKPSPKHKYEGYNSLKGRNIQTHKDKS